MTLYCGIDLHANNSVVAVLDEQDLTVYEKRLNTYQIKTLMCFSTGGNDRRLGKSRRLLPSPRRRLCINLPRLSS